MPRITFNGDPGTTWTNDTGKIRYQMQVQFSNSCGVCIQYAGAIGSYWPIPFHRGCRCQNVPIYPGGTSQPFVDFMAEIKALPPQQQSVAVGASNWRLIESGKVDWKEVVTPTRVRDLREVVARNKLSVKDMVKAGVKPRWAEAAHASVNTPEHQVVRQVRQELVDRLKGAGGSSEQIKEAVASRLAARVGITQGPSGPQAMPIKPFTPMPLFPLAAQVHEVVKTLELPRPQMAKVADVPDFHGNVAEAETWFREQLGDRADLLTDEDWEAFRAAVRAAQGQTDVLRKLGVNVKQLEGPK